MESITDKMKRRDARRVPIIAMSANAFAEDIINSRLAGMNVHLAKPLDAEKMIVALKQCMADNSDVKLHEDLSEYREPSGQGRWITMPFS